MKCSSGCRAARLCACVTLLVCLGLQLAAAEVIANPIAAAKGGQSTISSSAKQQPAASKPAEATPRRGFLKPRGVKQPAKPAGSSGSLPRPLLLGKGSGALRQAAGGAGGAGGAGAGDTTDVLPFCEPRVGVICTNNDNVINFLETEADPIAFDGTPFFEVGTQGEAALNGETVVNGFTDSLASTLTATTSTAFTTPNVLATEGLNLATDTQEVLGGLAVDGSRLDRVLPDSISTAAGATNIAGTYESTNYVPRFTYIIGANFGAPFGLATNDRK